MKTQINGKDAPWTPEIQAKWDAIVPQDERPVTLSNYFTPRPYVDEYNRGSNTEGFTYIRGHNSILRSGDVYQFIIRRG